MRVMGKRDSDRIRRLAAMINSSSKADFVRRLLDERRKYLVDGGGGFSTHELAYRDDGRGNAVVYPLVQSVGNGLHRFDDDMAYDRAVYLGDTLNMRTPDAKAFTEGYKSVYPMYFQPELAPVGDLTSAYEMEPPESRGLVPFMYEPDEVEVVEEPVVDLFSDEAKARRRVKQRYAESKFNDKAFNKDSKAQGAWQIVPITYQDYLGRGKGKAGDLDDPEYNGKIRDFVMGIIPRDLKKHWSENDSDLNKLAKLYAAYNWGAGNLRGYFSNRLSKGLSNDDPREWVEGLNPETKRYVKYLVFDEDFDDGSGYTTKGFEEAAKARGYMASGGRIHIKPENRGKFTALKKRTGHSASWFKAHGTPAQKKMAVFALNSKHWSHKHGDGGFMHNYFDGETESTGLMQRVPNWVVRGQDYSEWKPSDIQEIINWGYTDPYAFFGQEGQSTRDALSRAGMADSVIGDIYRNAPVELQARLGDRYMGTAQRQDEYNQGIRDYTNYVAPRLGAAMAGSLLGAEGLSVAAPWLVDVAAPAVQWAANTNIGRRIRGGLDVLGTIDGIRNAFSDNGLSKTYRLIDEGRYGRAALSGLGDVFDITGGVGYIRGVGKRGAEAILRMGDEARRAGELWNRAFYDAKSLGKTGLKKLAHVPKYIKDQYKSYGHTSKQLLDKNTLEYIFNPMANPDLAYQMPYNYSGDFTEFEKKGKHQYDRINEFLGKTQPDNVEYVNVDDLPDGIKKWAKERYPGMKQLRVANIGKSRSRPAVDAEIRALGPGDDMANIRRSSTGIMDESRVDMLDPGHHGVDLVVDESGNVYATGHDVYKYNEKDWLKKWKNDFDKKQKEAGEVAKPKTKYQEYLDDKYGEGYSDMSMMGRLKYFGLRFLDRHGSPLIYNWDYGKVGHVPSYNMNPSTKVSMLSPNKDSSIEYIDDYIAQKKRALAATTNPFEISDLKDDIESAEFLKRQKAPKPPQPYKPIFSNPTDIDIAPPSHPLPPKPTTESSIDEIDDFIHKMEAELKLAGDPEEYYGILDDLEYAENLKKFKPKKFGEDFDLNKTEADLDAVKWADEDLDDVDSPDMPVFSDWLSAQADKAKVTSPDLGKLAKSKMSDEEVSALQDYIKKQVQETKAKIDLSKFKTKGGVGDIGPEHGIFGMDIDDYKLTPDDIAEMDDATFAKLSKSFNLKPKTDGPDVDEIPWAYGGLLNRMSKFYNNDRSSMLNLVRKVKAGMN